MDIGERDGGRIGAISGRVRRRWTVEEKAAIVAESDAGPISISDVARRHGIAPSQLFQWRRQVWRERPGKGATDEGFVPVVGAAAAEAAAGDNMAAAMEAAHAAGPGDTIEVVIGTISVRVPAAADAAAVRRVLGIVRSLA